MGPNDTSGVICATSEFFSFFLESGTHNELIQAGGAYARLVQSQKLCEGQGERESSGVFWKVNPGIGVVFA